MSSRTCLMLLALALTSSGAEDTSTGQLRGTSKEDVRGLEIPDASGLPDTPGPYSEVPSDADAEKPRSTLPDWRSKVPNATQGSLGSLISLQDWQEHQFCNVHETGFFCDGLTRIRCCKLEDGYAKCGSTANSTFCAAQQEPESAKQKALWFWHIHPGWHVSSFCRSHHVGSFCSSHHIIHCCNDHGHYVECNTAFFDSGRWC